MSIRTLEHCTAEGVPLAGVDEADKAAGQVEGIAAGRGQGWDRVAELAAAGGSWVGGVDFDGIDLGEDIGAVDCTLRNPP